MSRGRIRVAVVFGGRSGEHPISCVSAGCVLAALDPARYEVLPVGITRDGRWVLPPDGQRLAIESGALPEVTDGAPLALPADPSAANLVVLAPGEVPATLGSVDVVFPLLHGAFGEDGTVQGLLEMAGVPYVGSGVFASAAAMDKAHMKVMLRVAGLPVGPYVVLKPHDAIPAALDLRLPVFVKPARAGSSLGITRVTDWADLPAAVAAARAHDPKVLVEEGITGRELECGVLGGLGGGRPEASLPAEVRVVGNHEFYDFEAKYLDDATELDVPALVPDEVTARVRTLAVDAFEALDCAGLARVDFFVTEDGRGGWDVVVNEVNTMPGFTPVSMFPLMWEATGLDYPALVDRLIRLAVESGTGLR
ncbi:MAG TPA: D-alanine--D-alanine ligase family protein [Mycobacteriales bacterium]|nr:D-alanine--D-alanine ligase family protein [Mycobacteriales bacterium]